MTLHLSNLLIQNTGNSITCINFNWQQLEKLNKVDLNTLKKINICITSLEYVSKHDLLKFLIKAEESNVRVIIHYFDNNEKKELRNFGMAEFKKVLFQKDKNITVIALSPIKHLYIYPNYYEFITKTNKGYKCEKVMLEIMTEF